MRAQRWGNLSAPGQGQRPFCAAACRALGWVLPRSPLHWGGVKPGRGLQRDVLWLQQLLPFEFSALIGPGR